MKESITGYAFDDQQTREALFEVHQKYQYTIDPHGAVGYQALKQYQEKHRNTKGVILETAHPAKFLDEVEQILNKKVSIPDRLAILADRKKEAVWMSAEFERFKKWLLDNVA
jgi:threonine synthase